MLDFILALSVNSVNYITTSIKYDKIDNIVEFYSNTSAITIDSIKQSIGSIDGRQKLFDKGIEYAKEFILEREQQQRQKEQIESCYDYSI
jgi:hypothetical protein